MVAGSQAPPPGPVHGESRRDGKGDEDAVVRARQEGREDGKPEEDPGTPAGVERDAREEESERG